MTRRDQAAFVGRRPELGFLDSLFVEDPPANVVLLHGLGGIGKSTLIRRMRHTGEQAGWTSIVIEGRELPPVPEALDDAVARVRTFKRPLLVFDSYERMEALGGHLRRNVLPELPDATIVVIAGRREPDPAWREGGWENVSVELELGPLSAKDAESLLEAQGVEDETRARELAEWAGGSPLALTLAASAAVADPGWSPTRQGERPEIVRALIRQLADGEIDPMHRDAISVASIARLITTEMLREVLPDLDAAETLHWLGQRSFAEPLGDGLTIHELVRRAALADLRQRSPERAAELRRRIADHLHRRAVAGNTLLTVDLAELVESEAVRTFYGWEGAVRNRIDSLRPSDHEHVARLLASKDNDAWWEATRSLFEETPDHVVIARDHDDDLCGYSIAVTPASATEVARRDVLLGPWLDHAAEFVPDGNAIVWRDSVDFTDDPASGIQGMLNMVWVLRCGLSNPRYAYLPIDPRHATARQFSEALGGRHIPELDVQLGRTQVECHLLDYGESGLLGLQRAFIYMELGLPVPTETAPAPAIPVPATDVSADVVRNALRSLGVPAELARSELASGVGIERRAASVRALLQRGAAGAFGESDNEQLLRRVLTRGYLEPAPSHEVAADELNLSRAAYFRRLKLASQRLAEYMAG